MLQPLTTDVWFADGPVVSFNGFDYPTRMAVVRLADGGLWLWSPVALTDALDAAVRALGPVRHLVSPNKLHYVFLAQWQVAFPEAKLWGTAQTVAKCRDLRFAGTLGDDPPADWAGQIDQYRFTNSPFVEELIFFHRASRTALIADLSQTFTESFLKAHWPWWLRVIARWSGMTEGQGHPRSITASASAAAPAPARKSEPSSPAIPSAFSSPTAKSSGVMARRSFAAPFRG